MDIFKQCSNYKRNIGLALLGLSGYCAHAYGDFKIEGGASYFYPTSHVLRQVYGAGANYHITLSQRIFKPIDLWAGANYFSQYGHSLGAHQRTHIEIFPISLGLKYLFPVKLRRLDLDVYVNGAFKYYFVNIHDHSSYVKSHTHKNGLGGVFGVGSYIHLTKHFFLNVLIDYSFKEFHESNHKNHVKGHHLNVGGWDFGGGIGFQF